MEGRNQRNKRHTINIGTFNIRGAKQNLKKCHIATDMEHYKMDVLAIQETHIEGNGSEIITSEKGRKYILYHGDGTKKDNNNNKNRTYNGVGFVVREDLEADFKSYTDRISMLTVKSKNENRSYRIISAYAPTLPVSEKDPKIREDFYTTLENIMNTLPKRDVLVVAGDYNAKTGTGCKQYPDCMGYHGKGILNSNGEQLLEFCSRNKLYLTNTYFPHKKAHRTTWTGPNKVDENGKQVRNQIDYILVKQQHKPLVNNSRSYSGTLTFSDHNLVICNLNTKWYTITHRRKPIRKFDVNKLKDKQVQNSYKDKVIENLLNIAKPKDVQEWWNSIVESCHKASKEVLGYRENGKRKKYDDDEIILASQKQKQLKLEIDQAKTNSQRTELQEKRHRVMRTIENKIKQIEGDEILDNIKDIEKCKGDSHKMFTAAKKLARTNPKQTILVNTENGSQTSNETKATEIVSDFFHKTFSKANQTEFPNITPIPMETPFTTTEVEKAIQSLKNNKVQVMITLLQNN